MHFVRDPNYKKSRFCNACSADARDGAVKCLPDRRHRRHHHPPRQSRPRAVPPRPRRASIGHISFGITPFDPDAVKAELDKRGLKAREDTGGQGDIHTARYKSYHTTTPNGYDLQISATTTNVRMPITIPRIAAR
jgi:hypothetical protein